ncbi:hypothetical protein CNY89_21210 [Amaricoccus sp. HAR-UPW-R2A-40]|nr:hypothetical protein CNY89_21210 [Amaricoccus sp. HAR-UPW-R2A-40]
MADVIVVTFEDETAAFGLRAALGKLQRDYLIETENVVVVTRDETGGLPPGKFSNSHSSSW